MRCPTCNKELGTNSFISSDEHSVWGEEANDIVLERYRKTLEL